MKILTSRKGFTLIELLVVIGILAVLAAIAIPSVAGLIDRANVSADNTNCNEMTNAIERFTSEYELYCQDIASGVIKDADSNGVPDDMDGAQGRVFNVTKAITRANITALESAGLGDRQINRDTKYPTNLETLKAVVENYTKTSSATFEPKQSDCSFYYSPDCGVVVCAPTDATVAQLNALILSGKDAKGNTLSDTTNWSNVTLEATINGDAGNSNGEANADCQHTNLCYHNDACPHAICDHQNLYRDDENGDEWCEDCGFHDEEGLYEMAFCSICGMSEEDINNLPHGMNCPDCGKDYYPCDDAVCLLCGKYMGE